MDNTTWTFDPGLARVDCPFALRKILEAIDNYYDGMSTPTELYAAIQGALDDERRWRHSSR